MKICYAFRRSVFYPWHTGHVQAAFPPRDVRRQYLAKVRELGFQGLELGADVLSSYGPALEDDAQRREAAAALRRELEDAGVPCVVIRGGGGMASPRVAAHNKGRLSGAVQLAAWLGAGLVNTTVGTPLADPGGPGSGTGERTSQGGSRTASADDYERTADGLREIADLGAGLGVEVSIEVHQHSLVDNSWSALHLLDLIDRPNVGVNPDLGNIYWTYETPEETCEAAIATLASRAKYWHCKNLYRVHAPEFARAVFLTVPLPDGDIDYRFAISAMVEAGYKGYLAVEGVRHGDQLYKDGRSVAYVREILRALNACEE